MTSYPKWSSSPEEPFTSLRGWGREAMKAVWYTVCSRYKLTAVGLHSEKPGTLWERLSHSDLPNSAPRWHQERQVLEGLPGQWGKKPLSSILHCRRQHCSTRKPCEPPQGYCGKKIQGDTQDKRLGNKKARLKANKKDSQVCWWEESCTKQGLGPWSWGQKTVWVSTEPQEEESTSTQTTRGPESSARSLSIYSFIHQVSAEVLQELGQVRGLGKQL